MTARELDSRLAAFRERGQAGAGAPPAARALLGAGAAHYGASLTAPEFASWLPPAGSADADLLPELSVLRARSRDLVRNTGLAAGAVQTLADNVVGTGLRLSAKPDWRALGRDLAWATEWSRRVESLWRGWAESMACDAGRSLHFQGLTTQVFRGALANGEALGLPLWLPGRPEGRFALALQVIEADRLENPDGRPDGEFLRGGVEIDRHGAPVAYHLRKGHPGDGYLTGLAWERIPAFTSWGRRRVIHAHDKERSGQNRGKPFAAAVMGAFKMMDRYERAELQAAIVNAVIAAFIETPMAAEDVESLFGQAADPAAYLAARQQNRGALMPGGGAIIPLHPGERLASFTPNRPASNFPAFMDSILQRIAAGLNMSLQSFLRDFEKVSYAGGRLAILADWRFFQGRRHWLSTYWCQPVYELWLEEAVDLGLVEAPEFYANRAAYCRARWIGPGKGWIDPVKEAKGASLRIQGLMSTFEMECAEQGLDFEEVAEDLAREAGELERLGLPSPWRLKDEPMAEDGPGEGEREEP